MAAEHDTVAWVLYGAAGLVTLAMPAIPWFYLRSCATCSTSTDHRVGGVSAPFVSGARSSRR